MTEEALLALVESAEGGDVAQRRALFAALYDELHRMAQRELRRNSHATLSPTTLLFSESPSRIIATFGPAVADQVRDIAQRNNVPFAVIGQVGGDRLEISVNGREVVNAEITDLESAWRNGLSRKLQAEVPATV